MEGTAGHQSGGGFARLRIARGLSRRQLAEAANVSPTSVGRAESGYGLTRPVLDALAVVLGQAVYDVVPTIHYRVRPVMAGEDAVRPVLQARHERGWSRAEAARQLGVDKDVLARLEAGRPVHPANALKVADGYRLDVFDVVPDPSEEDNGTLARA